MEAEPVAHDFESYQPHVVTVWLGTNDIAAQVDRETFKLAYINLLKEVVYEPFAMKYADYSNGVFEQKIELKSNVTADEIHVFAWDTKCLQKLYL